MTILKGRDFEMVIVLTNCHTDIDISGITEFVCYFYTKEGGAAIERTKDQFTWDETGTIGTTILTGTELNGLEDGVLRYQFDADGQIVKRTANYYLKTPVDFSGQTYTTEEDVESIVNSMTEDFITEAELEEALSGITSGCTGIEYYTITQQNIEAIGASIWSRYSGLTVDELNAKVKLSFLGFELTCFSKTTNPDQFNFHASVYSDNGSYWVFQRLEAWVRETGSYCMNFANPTPICILIDLDSENKDLSLAPEAFVPALNWLGVERAARDGAVIIIQARSASTELFSTSVARIESLTNPWHGAGNTYNLYADFIIGGVGYRGVWHYDQNVGITNTSWTQI